jgi:phospholipid/cholesterol/gamma-HCH transport system substrate-binding protein
MYRDLLKDIGEIETAVRDAASTTGAIGQDLYGDKLYRQISEPVHRLDQSLAAIQSGQGTLGQLLRDTAQYDRAISLAQNLRKGIADLRTNELMRSDQLYTSLSSTLAGMTRSVDRFNASPEFGTSAMYDNLNGMAKELEATLKDFRENPKKYLRLKLF